MVTPIFALFYSDNLNCFSYIKKQNESKNNRWWSKLKTWTSKNEDDFFWRNLCFHRPETKPGNICDALKLDKRGYIRADEDMRTNSDGVFDVCEYVRKKYRQITTAIADGTIAAIAITGEIG